MSKWLSTNWQPATWAQHALVSIGISFLFALLTRTGQVGMLIAGWLIVVFFIVREERNEDDHKAAGDWLTPEPSSGVTPRTDKVGDLVGPVTVAVGYTIMYLAGLWLG